MSQDLLLKQILYGELCGKRRVERSRTRWLDYIKDLGWNRLGFSLSEMQSVLVNREVWRLNLELLPRNPQGKAGKEKRRR